MSQVLSISVVIPAHNAAGMVLVEIWFSLLTRKALNGTSFKGKTLLREAIEAFIANSNQNPRPFRWRKREVRRKREVKGSQLRNTLVCLGSQWPTELAET